LREKESFVPGVTSKAAEIKEEEKEEDKAQPAEKVSAEKSDDTQKIIASPAAVQTDQKTKLAEKQGVRPFPDRKMLIYFKHNSNDLPDEAFEALDRIAEFMIHNPESKVSVKGYTDSSGTRSYNISVSQFRANTIKSYLVGKGVRSSHIDAVGLGPENPIATNATEAGRRSNRRVEIELNIDNPE
jgi:outer membrane protein OmpA-like peptidoglycan-associated protein